MKPRWKKGWPNSVGDYFVRLQCGDTVAMEVRRYVDDEGKVWLEARDTMDGVCFETPNPEPLEKYWGKATASYGPVPKYRGKIAASRNP